MFALAGSTAFAQNDAPAGQPPADISVRSINDQRVGALMQQAADLNADANTAAQNKDYATATRLRNEADALYAKAQQSQTQTEGMVGRMNQVEAQIENDKTRLDNEKDMYGKPSFWDKVGDKALDTGWSLLDNMIQKWLDGGGEDDELLNQINNLQDERDRLLNERDNPAAGGGVGRIITDPNGNYGYDRDGDGFVDIPLNPDGTPAGDFNPTGTEDFDSFGDDLAGLGGGLPMGGGGGGASFGGGGGGPGFGGIGSGGIDGATGGEGLAAGGEDADGGFPGASAGEGEDGDLDGANASKDGDSETDDQGREIENIMGRFVILPKVEDEAEIAGKEEESSDWSDDFEEWGDDDWDDGADNGDKKPEGEEWAEPKLVGDGEKEAKLVEELIRVQSVIQGWQDETDEDKDAEEEDPYGFNDDAMSGYEEPGEDKKDEEEDPYKDVRDEDGKIDVTKVDIWVIDRDSWKKDKTPIRYKVKAPLDLKDFDPIPGGVLVARGIVEELEVKDSVMKTIKGEVKKLEIVSVILSAEKPPEDMDSLDPSKTEDSDVGGLEEDDLGDDEDGDGW
jgi:hypothetical protein